MKFEELESALEDLVRQLEQANLLQAESLRSAEFLEIINRSVYLITIHDVAHFRPIGLNNASLTFYGFQENWLRGMDYFYYLQTIHTSTYHTLLNSLSYFRKDKTHFLNLEYKLLNHNKDYKLVLGSSKTIIRSQTGKPLYAITVAREFQGKESANKADLIRQLSPREKEIAKLMIDGKSKREIGELLFISLATVQTHCKTIYKKLEINKISELISLGDTYSFALADQDALDVDLSQHEPRNFSLGLD